jgi:hypothetical protein
MTATALSLVDVEIRKITANDGAKGIGVDTSRPLDGPSLGQLTIAHPDRSLGIGEPNVLRVYSVELVEFSLTWTGQGVAHTCHQIPHPESDRRPSIGPYRVLRGRWPAR